MVAEKFFKVGITICAVVLFSSFGLICIYNYICPSELTANHIIEIYSHGEYFYTTLAQYILLVSMACTGGLGIIILGVIQEVLAKKRDKLKLKDEEN